MTSNFISDEPLLKKSGFDLPMDKPHLKDEEESAHIRQFSNIAAKKSRRPSLNFSKDKIKTLMHQPLAIRRKTQTEPIIHYNGPCETLDQLPQDKYNWIISESCEKKKDHKHINPLIGYPKYIVFRKPHRIHAAGIGLQNEKPKPKSKGIFYLRVLQVNSRFTSKACYIKPTVTIDNQAFYGSYTHNQKTGKIGAQAAMDETYLIDFYKESTASFSIYSKTKSFLGAINSHFKKPDQCLGTRDFKIKMIPCEKKIERINIQSSDSEEQHQVLLIYGTFIGENVMALLHNTLIYEQYITVYTKGSYTPRWNRYWGKLSPKCFQLYDFEYKDTRKPAYEIPLVYLLDIYNPPVDDDERLVDVGSHGLALQFSDHVLDETEIISEKLEYRIYVLPDNTQISKEWETAFKKVIGLIKEYQYDNCFDATRFNQNDKSIYIPSKVLW